VSPYEWTDDFDSIGDLDDFIATMHGEPTEAQLRALGIYSTRRAGERVERRLAGDLRTHAKPRPERRKAKRLRAFYALLWLANPNVLLFAAASVGLWFALNWAAK